MKQILSENLISWSNELDPNAKDQALKCSMLPVLAGPVALMPDAHYGLGATVGSVIATKNAIIPAAVGVDIGCGMIASQLSIYGKDLPNSLEKMHSRLRNVIPVGVGQGKFHYLLIGTIL